MISRGFSCSSSARSFSIGLRSAWRVRSKAAGCSRISSNIFDIGLRIAIRVSRFSFLVSRFSFLVSRFSFLVSRFSFLVSRFSFLVSRFSFLVGQASGLSRQAGGLPYGGAGGELTQIQARKTMNEKRGLKARRPARFRSRPCAPGWEFGGGESQQMRFQNYECRAVVLAD